MDFVPSFAPGRVELLGNHTDYNDGVVLSAALDFGITARGRLSGDGRITLASAGMETVEADADNLAPGRTWADYPLGVARMMQLAGQPVRGFSAEFSSTLPLGAGLSSSAAIEVCTAYLLTRLFGFDATSMELAKLCRQAENEFVGVNCGLLDQVSSIFGKKNHAVFLDCRSEAVETIPFPEGVALLIVHSGVKHALTGGEYNERREQCFEAARRLGVAALRDASSEQLLAADMPELVRRRALHITGENERVHAAAGHLRKGDTAAFGRLMTASHRSSMENFENSTPELDALVEIACAQPGVHGARLTGGGFGGAIVALADAEEVAEAGPAVERAYLKRTGHRGTAYRCTISDGAACFSGWKS